MKGLVGFAAVLLLAACGSPSASAGTPSRSTSPPKPDTISPLVPITPPISAVSTPVVASTPLDYGVHLAFDGYLTGTMTANHRGGGLSSSRPSNSGFDFPTRTRCGRWSDTYGSYWQADIVGDVAGGQWALSLSYSTNGAPPGTFHINGKPGSNDASADAWLVPAAFPKDTTSWYATYGASGSFSVEPDLQHGSIDLVLPEGPTFDGRNIHIAGLWRCN
jgi:hypothetical protein